MSEVAPGGSKSLLTLPGILIGVGVELVSIGAGVGEVGFNGFILLPFDGFQICYC